MTDAASRLTPSSGRARGTRAALLAVVAVLAALMVAPAGAAAAACTPPLPGGVATPTSPVPGSCFEGWDGNQIDDDGAGAGVGNDRFDWQTVSFSAANDFVSAGGSDTQFGSGGSEQTPDSWTFDFGSLGSDKYDIVNGYLAKEPNTNDLFLALAFIRASNNGTTHLSFELNQKQPGYRLQTETHSPTTPARKIAVPTRTAGDLLITYSVDPPVIGVCKWGGNEHTGAWLNFAGTAVAGSNCPTLGPSVAQGAMNADPIPAAENYLNGKALQAKTFAEASINLTEALKASSGDPAQPDPCVSFGYMWMHSRSSTSITSNQQDYILPDNAIKAANCAVSGKKINDKNGNGLVDGTDDGLGGWRIFVDYNGNGTPDAGEPSDCTAPGKVDPASTTGCLADANDKRPLGSYTVANVANGTWNVREVQKATWECTAPNVPDADPATAPPACAYRVTMTGQEIENNNFLNHLADATVTIRKDAQPDSTDDFSFTTTGAGLSGFSLEDDGDETNETGAGTDFPSSRTFTIPAAQFGQKSVEEDGEAGWTRTSLSCSGVPGITYAGGKATFTVGAGDAVTCDYVNAKDATIELTKVAQPADGEDFGFSGDLGTFKLDDGGSADATKTTESFTIAGNATGTKSISEDLKAGWAASDITCTGASSFTPTLAPVDANGVQTADGVVNVLVNPGDDIECTFTNQKAATIRFVKNVVSSSHSNETFAFTGPAWVNGSPYGDNEGETETITAFPAADQTVAETKVAGWTEAVSCTGDAGDTTSTGDDGAGMASATFRPDPGEAIVCTFTNTEDAVIAFDKQVVSSTHPSQTFAFSGPGWVDSSPYGDNQGDSLTISSFPAADQTVSETKVAGWTETVDCTGDAGDTTSTGDDGAGNASATFRPDPGERIACTFTNTEDAVIEFDKQVVSLTHPNETFAFTGASFANSSPYGDGQGDSETITSFPAADRTVSETKVAGWTEVVSCAGDAGDTTSTNDDGAGNASATFRPDPGETISCTFTNTEDAKLITKKVVDSVTDPNEEFSFSGGAIPGAPQLLGDQETRTQTITAFSPALELASTEVKKDGWRTTIGCAGDDLGSRASATAQDATTATATFRPEPGETVTCTFTNTEDAKVTIVKQTVGGDGTFTFSPNAALRASSTAAPALDGANQFTLPNGGSQAFTDVVPSATGGYAVTESVPDGWRLTRIECSDDDSTDASGNAGVNTTATIRVSPGEELTCTYTNTKNATLQLTKTESGQTPSGTWEFQLTGGPDGVSITKTTSTAAGGNALDFGQLREGDYTLCERHIPLAWHTSLEEAPYDGTREPDGADQVKVCVTVSLVPGQDASLLIDNTRPSTLVVKEGNVLIHHGELITYTFDVSNDGNVPLVDVKLTDAKCESAIARDAAADKNADGDNALEPAGTPDGSKSEVWRFTCTSHAPTGHAAGEQNPIPNTVSAQAEDAAGNVVTASDGWSTTIIHPAIDVQKLQRRNGLGEFVETQIEAHAGDTIDYRFVVTNVGDTRLHEVGITDPKCNGAISGPVKPAGDADEWLAVGETWTYTCSHLVVAADLEAIHNRVDVTATDDIGGDNGTATDFDEADVDVLIPVINVDKKLVRGDSGEFVQGPIAVHVGETVTYQLLVTSSGPTPLTSIVVSDPKCDVNTLAGPVKSQPDEDQWLEPGETWTYTCTRVVKAGDGPTLENIVTVTGSDNLGGTDDDDDSAVANVLTPGTLVIKEGNTFAYHGDTVTFTFAVSNNGNAPLTNVKVVDDRCPGVSGTPGEKRNDDGDALLESLGTDGATSEVWVFTCTMAVPAHSANEENPIHNTATATADDPLGQQVQAVDDHTTTILHPAVDIDKTGPATALAGQKVTYQLVVTNPGDVQIIGQTLQVTDPKCDAPPALAGKARGNGADPTPDTLDPGDAWFYTCTVSTQVGQTSVVNTALVHGFDPNGKVVDDTDDATTALTQPAIEVKPEVVVSGASKLSGPASCVTRAFKVRIAGKRIARVTITIDGKAVKTFRSRTGTGKRFVLTVNPARYGNGIHRLKARVVYNAASQTRPRTLRMAFERCVKQVIKPQFTG